MKLLAIQLSHGLVAAFLFKFNKLIFFKQRMYGLKCVKTVGVVSKPIVSQARSFTPCQQDCRGSVSTGVHFPHTVFVPSRYGFALDCFPTSTCLDVQFSVLSLRCFPLDTCG
jgi:hypothetical protein